MARAGLAKDKESGGKFEKFLFFVTPIIFTVVLLAVLLTLFNVNVRDGLFNMANKIPVVKNFVPDSKDTTGQTVAVKKENKEESDKATIKKLQAKIAEQEEQIKKAKQASSDQETELTKIKTENESLQQQVSGSTDTKVDPYQEQIKQLAKMYSDMQPSKAAPIMESLTTEEMVLILNAMKSDERIGILEKMKPEIAAEATMKLKEAKTSDNLAIAALQSQLKKKQASSSTAQTNSGLDKTQLSQTFAGMAPENAATILLQTYKINSEKALTILSSMDDSTRSKVLEAISKNDAATAAQLVNKLMGTK